MSNFPPAILPSGIRRIVVVDSALVSRSGHHYNYDRAVIEAAKARGLDVLVLCGQAASPEIVEEFAAIPFFAIQAGAKMMPNPQGPPGANTPFAIEGYQAIALNTQFFLDFHRMTPLIRPDDQLFFTAMFPSELIAFSQWLTLLPAETRPFSTLLLRAWNDRPHFRAIHELCSTVLGRPEMKCRICSDSMELSLLYGEVLRRPVDLIPFPQISHDAIRSDRTFRPAGDQITIGFVGSCRENRGFLLLRSAIEEVLHDPPRPCHFLVQAGGNHGCPPDIFMAEAQALWAMPKSSVSMIVEITSTADYYALVHDCDIILLCYDPDYYRYEPSGVFAEAMTAGKVMVITSGTSMEREAQRFGAGFTSNAGFTAPAIAMAIKRALMEYPTLAARAETIAASARQFHNAEKLISYLVDGSQSAMTLE